MAQYTDALTGILIIELQQTVPAKKVPGPSNQPTRNHDRADKATTARDLVHSHAIDAGDYHGRALEDVYITAPQLAEVVGFSEQTARRRLEYFEEQDVVKLVYEQDGYRNHYRLTDEFSGLADDNVRSAQEITDTAKKLLALAEEL